MDDHELLHRYVTERSQDAFGAIVQRHLKVVYGAAHRMTNDSHLAEEIAQNVFITLASRAGQIQRTQVIGGWLYNTTRHEAMHALRTKQRRNRREQAAYDLQETESATPTEALELLEPCMAELEEQARDALVLRFMQDKSFREIGGELGLSEDAARMRVNRAVDRLREIFLRKRTSISTSVLLATLTSISQASVPAGLASAITTSVCTSLIPTAATITIMTWLNAKSFTAIVAASLLAGTGVYFKEQLTIKALQEENGRISRQRDQLSEERDEAQRRAAAHQEELSLKEDNIRELLRLRNQVSLLQKQAAAAEASVKAGLPIPQPAPGPGQYIPKDQLVYAGLGSPEASAQSFVWAIVHGNFETITNIGGAHLVGIDLTDPQKARERFANETQRERQTFLGFQVLARKTFEDGTVELKLKMETEPPQDQGNSSGGVSMRIAPMKLDGAEWKINGPGRAFDSSWEESGNIEVFGE